MTRARQRRASRVGIALASVLAVHGCSEQRDESAAATSTAPGAGGDALAGAGSSAGAGGATAAAGTGGATAGAGTGGASAGSAGSAGSGTAGSSPATAGTGSAGDAGLGAPDAGTTPSACAPCTEYGAPERIGNVQLAELDQLSGIAVSARDPSVLFAHNDRTSTTVFALALDGRVLARFALDAVTTVDLEDIAVGTCPSGRCLYLADIGGNLAPRSEYAILRAPEPAVDPSAPLSGEQPLAVERFRFAYEDGSHNAEGILIDPGSGALYVVTKVGAGQPSSVYRLPDALDPSGLNMAVKVADLSVPGPADSPATSSSAHPCGTGFVLRTNDQLYEFRIAPGAPFESAFEVEPVLLESGDEPQSEGVSYLPDGRGFVTCGEMADAPIYRSRCR